MVEQYQLTLPVCGGSSNTSTQTTMRGGLAKGNSRQPEADRKHEVDRSSFLLGS